MKLLFRILKSSFTDKLAYLSAVAGALCWLVHARYPAIFPGPLKATAHIYTTIVASLAAGMMIAKYVLREGYLRSMQEVKAEKEAFAVIIQRLEAAMREIQEERDRISGRESLLKNRLKSFENSATEAQLSSLRKKIRMDEEDRKTSLALLAHELKNHLHGLDNVFDPDVARAVGVLKKEVQLLENETKKGERSLYELILKSNEIREYIADLTLLRLQSGSGPADGCRSTRPARTARRARASPPSAALRPAGRPAPAPRRTRAPATVPPGAARCRDAGNRRDSRRSSGPPRRPAA